MNKLELAHEYAKAITPHVELPMDKFVDLCFSYAEAMLSENEKRKDKSRPEVLEEWQPDWIYAPDGFNYWAATCQNGKISGGWFFQEEPEIGEAGETSIYYNGESSVLTDSFGYQGNWWDSLRKRP